jgi:hypothetical protein
MNDITSEGGQDMSNVTPISAPPKVDPKVSARIDALQKIDASLEEAEWPLSEAGFVLPELSLQDVKSIEKIGAQVVKARDCINHARALCARARHDMAGVDDHAMPF